MKSSKLKSILIKPIGKHKLGHKCPTIISYMIRKRLVTTRESGAQILLIASILTLSTSAILFYKTSATTPIKYKLSKTSIQKLPSEVRIKITQ